MLRSRAEQAQGLIGMSPIPRDTVFVFPGIQPGALFHSSGVLEPFELAFLASDGHPITLRTIIPPRGIQRAPEGTVRAVESAVGVLSRLFSM